MSATIEIQQTSKALIVMYCSELPHLDPDGLKIPWALCPCRFESCSEQLIYKDLGDFI